MVEFDFDLAADTAYSVASEMVSDLSLSHEDAKVCLSSMSTEPSYLLRECMLALHCLLHSLPSFTCSLLRTPECNRSLRLRSKRRSWR